MQKNSFKYLAYLTGLVVRFQSFKKIFARNEMTKKFSGLQALGRFFCCVRRKRYSVSLPGVFDEAISCQPTGTALSKTPHNDQKCSTRKYSSQSLHITRIGILSPRYLGITLLVAFLIVGNAQKVIAQVQQDIIIDQVMVATATIINPDSIQKIVRISLLPENADSIKSITFIDANNNGFGSDDFVLLQPSGHTYELIPSAALSEMIKNWRFTAATQLVGGPGQSADFLEDIKEEDPQKKAANFILASLLRGLNNNYTGHPMNLYFRRGVDGAYAFDMWGYETANDSLYWQPPKYPPGGYIKNYDIFRVHRADRDTLFLSNTRLYDQIYIYHNVTDTIFIAPDSTKFGHLQTPPQYQPGLTSPGRKKKN